MYTKSIEQVADRCGISLEAVENMIGAGWTYVEYLGGTIRWVAPERRVPVKINVR